MFANYISPQTGQYSTSWLQGVSCLCVLIPLCLDPPYSTAIEPSRHTPVPKLTPIQPNQAMKPLPSSATLSAPSTEPAITVLANRFPSQRPPSALPIHSWGSLTATATRQRNPIPRIKTQTQYPCLANAHSSLNSKIHTQRSPLAWTTKEEPSRPFPPHLPRPLPLLPSPCPCPCLQTPHSCPLS